jgi:hypothetical protein
MLKVGVPSLGLNSAGLKRGCLACAPKASNKVVKIAIKGFIIAPVQNRILIPSLPREQIHLCSKDRCKSNKALFNSAGVHWASSNGPSISHYEPLKRFHFAVNYRGDAKFHFNQTAIDLFGHGRRRFQVFGIQCFYSKRN